MADNNDNRPENVRMLNDANVNNEDNTVGEGKNKPSLLAYALMAACAVFLFYGVWNYAVNSTRTSYTTLWETSEKSGDESETFKGYSAFAGGIIKYTKDGAEFIDGNGNAVWDRSYQMNSPIVDVSANYAVLADQGRTNIYIFSNSELVGVCETILPISLVRISDSGIIYAVLNDSDAEYITAFKSDGTAIDLSVKSILTGDGYPFDIDVSPDGTQLITSYVGIEDGAAVNNVVFRNFGTVGINTDARRIVGGFKDEFVGHLAGKVNFSTNAYSQAFYDGGVVFFSTQVLNTPEVLANVSFEERMIAVAASAEYSAILLENESNQIDSGLGTGGSDTGNRAGAGTGDTSGKGGVSVSSGGAENRKGASSGTVKSGGSSSMIGRIFGGGNQDGQEARQEPVAPYRLVIYNNDGTKRGEAEISIGYRSMCFSGSSVVIYDSKSIRVYNSKGNLRASFDFDEGDISSVAGSASGNALFVMSGGNIYKISY